MAKLTMVLAGAAVVIVAAGGLLAVGRPGGAGVKVLVGDDLGQLRHEALSIFPRGEPVGQVEARLKELGFLCAPRHRPISNISAPTVECDSAGRGYPTASRMEVTVLARNGAVSDIAISNGMDGLVADARTPHPMAGVTPVAIATP